MEQNRRNSAYQEDYSCYTWYKGENGNPYEKDTFHPLAARFWSEEQAFHTNHLKNRETASIEADYHTWYQNYLTKTLPESHPFEDDAHIDWEKVFATGKRQETKP